MWGRMGSGLTPPNQGLRSLWISSTTMRPPASNRLVRLLENLRDITRLEETNNLVAQPVNLYDLLRSTAAARRRWRR